MRKRTQHIVGSMSALALCAVLLLGLVPGDFISGTFATACTHEHTDECYSQELVCDKTAHKHTKDCYEQMSICEKNEHSHAEDCYDADAALVCEIVEHTHDGECVESRLACGLEEHDHAEECYTQVLHCSHVCGEECNVSANQLALDYSMPSTDITLKSYKITASQSGTWDKDPDDSPGNDNSTTNDTVLSLDKIVYITSYSVATASGIGVATGGSYYFEAVLPCGSNVASWNISGMSWMDNPKVTTDENGHQILSARLDLQNAQSAPRVGSLEWMINVNSTTNGQKIPAPVFSMWVGHEEKSDDAISATEKDRNMTVSAKANYNAKINYEGEDSNGNRKWSLALQLKGSSLEKGMLGSAPPNGTLAFDVALSDNQKLVGYKLNNQIDTGTQIAADDYGKLVPFDDGAKTEEQTFNTVYNGGTVSMTPTDTGMQVKLTGITVPEQFYSSYVTHNAGKTNQYQGVDYNEDTYNFAAIYFVSTGISRPADGSTVTASATIEPSTMNDLAEAEKLVDTGESDNVATYSFTAPTQSTPGGSTGPWQGNWVGKVDHFSGEVESYENDGYTQLNVGDRFRYQIQISYAQHYGNTDGLPVSDRAFVKFSGKAFDVVDDSAYKEYAVSSECRYNPGSGYVPVSDEVKVTESNVQLQYVTLKSGGDWSSESAMFNARYNTSTFNVYNSVEELKASGEICVGFLLNNQYPSYIYNNAYHHSYVELPVLEVRDRAILDSNGNLLDSSRVNERVYAQVVDLDNIKVRPKRGNTSTGSVDYDADRLATDLLVNPGSGYVYDEGIGVYQVNVSGNDGLANRLIGYKKTEYSTNGQETDVASHQGNERIHASTNGFLSGSSIKINTYSTYINKQIAQRTEDGSELNAFKVDRGQRRADFLINAGTSSNASVQSTETLTITDKIPADLYPLNSSITGTETADIEAKWGISYGGVAKQDSTTNGGAGVIWIDGELGNTVASTMLDAGVWKEMLSAISGWRSVPEVTYKLTETVDEEDGTTILTWTITNMPLGYAVPTIHYGTVIGTPENSVTDVQNGDALINRVSIKAELFLTESTDESRINVYKVSGGIIGKVADKEKLTSIDDPIGYTIDFSNNATLSSDTERDHIYVADVFHYLGDAGGSTDPGNYVLDNVSFSGKVGNNHENTELKLYYSTRPGATVAATLAKYDQYADIEFSDEIWEDPINISFDSASGFVNDAAVKEKLEGLKVTAFVFAGLNVPRNSRFSLHYGLAYENNEIKEEVIAGMKLNNTATLQIGGTVSQEAQSTATITGGVLFRFTKVDGSGNILTGAEFNLYKLTCTDNAHDHDNNIPDLIKEKCYTALQEDGEDRVFTCSEEGIVNFDLLDNGTYILVEITAPNGCQLPTGQWKLVINGTVEKAERVTVTAVGTVPAFYLDTQNEYKLPNYPKVDLPVSGGIGTVLFTVGGVVLIGAAILIVILTGRKKKRPNSQDSDSDRS